MELNEIPIHLVKMHTQSDTKFNFYNDSGDIQQYAQRKKLFFIYIFRLRVLIVKKENFLFLILNELLNEIFPLKQILQHLQPKDQNE